MWEHKIFHQVANLGSKLNFAGHFAYDSQHLHSNGVFDFLFSLGSSPRFFKTSSTRSLDACEQVSMGLVNHWIHRVQIDFSCAFLNNTSFEVHLLGLSANLSFTTLLQIFQEVIIVQSHRHSELNHQLNHYHSSTIEDNLMPIQSIHP